MLSYLDVGEACERAWHVIEALKLERSVTAFDVTEKYELAGSKVL